MAVQIPRSGVVQTVQKQAGRVVPDDGGAAGLNQIAGAMDQLGQTLRSSQHDIDMAEAGSRITTAKRMAAATAAEQGLYGDDYAEFMATSVAKARDEVSGLTELPEVKRTLSNQAMMSKENDRLVFEAEGRKLQVINEQNRIASVTDSNNLAVESDYYMDASGRISSELLEYMDSTHLAQMGESFLTPEERTKKAHFRRSQTGFAGGYEIIKGFTRNGKVSNTQLAQFLDVLNNPNHEYTSRMTAKDVEALKQLADQELDAKARAGAKGQESATKRINELDTNFWDKYKVREWQDLEELDRQLDLGIETLHRYSGENPDWERNPHIGKYASKDESNREAMNKAYELKFAIGIVRDLKGKKLGAKDLELMLNSMKIEQQTGEIRLDGNNKQLQSVFAKRDSETILVQSGEQAMLLAGRRALEIRLSQLQEDENKGRVTKEYLLGMSGNEAEARFGNAEVRDIAAQDLDAVVDFNSYVDIGTIRVANAKDATNSANMLGVAYDVDEVGTFLDGIESGDITDKMITQVAVVISGLAGTGADGESNDRLNHQLRMFGDKAPWMKSMVFAVEQGSIDLADTIASGYLVTRKEDYRDEVFWYKGGRQKTGLEISKMVASTFGGVNQDEEMQSVLRNAIYYGMIGNMNKGGSNRYSVSDMQEVVKKMYPEGVSFATTGSQWVKGLKFYPNAKDNDGTALNVINEAKRIKPEYFGTVFPSIRMSDDVRDDFAEEGGIDRLTSIITSGDADLVPIMEQPGVVKVMIKSDLSPQVHDVLLNPSGYLLDGDGEELLLDFNKISGRLEEHGFLGED